MGKLSPDARDFDNETPQQQQAHVDRNVQQSYDKSIESDRREQRESSEKHRTNDGE